MFIYGPLAAITPGALYDSEYMHDRDPPVCYSDDGSGAPRHEDPGYSQSSIKATLLFIRPVAEITPSCLKP